LFDVFANCLLLPIIIGIANCTSGKFNFLREFRKWKRNYSSNYNIPQQHHTFICSELKISEEYFLHLTKDKKMEVVKDFDHLTKLKYSPQLPNLSNGLIFSSTTILMTNIFYYKIDVEFMKLRQCILQR